MGAWWAAGGGKILARQAVKIGVLREVWVGVNRFCLTSGARQLTSIHYHLVGESLTFFTYPDSALCNCAEPPKASLAPSYDTDILSPE